MKTAAELLAQLNADPKWVKEKAKRDAYWAEVKERNKKEEEALVCELNAVGLRVNSISNVGPSVAPYPLAIPILFEHLKRPYQDNIRAMIARALGVPEAAYLHDELVAMLRQQIAREKAAGKDLKSTLIVVQQLAVAVAESTTEQNILSLIQLVQDESLGDDRLLILRRLRRSKDPRAADVLLRLADHPVFQKEIASWKPRPKRMTVR